MEGVNEGQRGDYFQGDEERDGSADSQVGACEQGFCKIPGFEVGECVLHRLIIPTYNNSQSNIIGGPSESDQMEQLQALKQTLSLPNFPTYPVTSFFTLGSYEIIMLTTILSLICTLVTGSTFPIYTLNGLFLPLLYLHYGNDLGSYWQWFAILLLARQIIHTLAVVDVSVL